MSTINRRILFFQVIPEDLDITPYLVDAHALTGHMMYTSYYDKEAFLDVTETGSIVKAKICYFQGADWPSVAKRNEKERWSLDLKSNEGLSNTSHFIYFPETGIVAFEYNFNAPRASAIVYHLKAKTQITADFDLLPIVNPSVLEDIGRLKDIRKISIRVKRGADSGEFERIDPSIGHAIRAAQEMNGTETVNISFSSGQKKDSSLGINPRLLLENVVNTLRQPSENLKQFKINGMDAETEKVTVIDLLQPNLISTASVHKMGRGRDVDSTDMFEQLEAAYKNKLRLLTGQQ